MDVRIEKLVQIKFSSSGLDITSFDWANYDNKRNIGAFPQIMAILELFNKKQSFSPNFDDVRFNFGNNDEIQPSPLEPTVMVTVSNRAILGRDYDSLLFLLLAMANQQSPKLLT